jgi:hypothetical protein
VKAGGKQSSRLPGISDYVGERREIEDRNSVPVGSPRGQKESRVLRRKFEHKRDESTTVFNNLHNELINSMNLSPR